MKDNLGKHVGCRERGSEAIRHLEVPAGRQVRGARVRARILIVDHEPAVLRAFVRQGRYDYEVETAASGAEAIQRALESVYDLILCDLHLYDMGASMLWETLRTSGEGTEQRLVFMTAGLVDEHVLGVCRQSAHPVLEKPVMPEDVETILRRLAGAPGGPS